MEGETQETAKGIETVFIKDEMKNCYLDYSMSVIVGRALPDVRDGLKPVHRRILYAMHALNNYHDKPFLKSARVVGDVIGKYHPHGDSAVYSTIVRMAQDFSMRYQLVDGQGNFGSIDGDSAAAMRYTEIRMKKLSEEMLKDLDKDTVDWRPELRRFPQGAAGSSDKNSQPPDQRFLRNRRGDGDEHSPPQYRGDHAWTQGGVGRSGHLLRKIDGYYSRAGLSHCGHYPRDGGDQIRLRPRQGDHPG